MLLYNINDIWFIKDHEKQFYHDQLDFLPKLRQMYSSYFTGLNKKIMQFIMLIYDSYFAVLLSSLFFAKYGQPLVLSNTIFS